MKYIKKFQTTAEYEAYIADTTNFVKPNVSLCKDTGYKYFTPADPIIIDSRVICIYNVEEAGEVSLFHMPEDPGSGSGSGSGSGGEDWFLEQEIDGVVQQEIVNTTVFTVGEHIVKYTLSNPTAIPDTCFQECDTIVRVILPNNVTTIGASAFDNCRGLTSCTIGDGVTSISGSTFSTCTSLTNIDIPDSVTSIGGYAFYACSGLTTCTIGSGVTTIGNEIFYDCSSLTSIVCNATTAPTIQSTTFNGIKTGGTLTVPSGSSGYNVWMGTGNYYLGKYNWTKVEQ